MPKPVLTLAAAWAEFDAMVFDGSVTSASKTRARRVFYGGAQDRTVGGYARQLWLSSGAVGRVICNPHRFAIRCRDTSPRWRTCHCPSR